MSVDAADGQQIEAAFDVIRARWNDLNALICAVGPPVSHQAWDAVTDAQFIDAFVVGALSAVRCARSALPMLRAAQWARIVNISAMSSRCQGRGLVDYSAAKSALTSMTKNLSLELGAEGILANTVSPGAIMSDQLTRDLAAVPAEYGLTADDPESVMRYISEKFGVRSDLGRAGLPGEIGAVICFLASQRNSYMTGANVNVDSGSAFFA
jgi:NAD(P)-dependent dehydrogenase (short-subunit alcohol dehydrogenase family)